MRSIQQKRRPARIATTALLLALGATALTACASRPMLTAPLFIPPMALQECRTEDPATVKTVQDLANYSIEQQRVITECEAKRRALVETITGSK